MLVLYYLNFFFCPLQVESPKKRKELPAKIDIKQESDENDYESDTEVV